MFSGPSSFFGTASPSPSATARPGLVHLRQQPEHALADGDGVHLAQLEAQRLDDVGLLGSDWLFQKSVAWLKWSKNLSAARANLRRVDLLRDS